MPPGGSWPLPELSSRSESPKGLELEGQSVGGRACTENTGHLRGPLDPPAEDARVRNKAWERMRGNSVLCSQGWEGCLEILPTD